MAGDGLSALPSQGRATGCLHLPPFRCRCSGSLPGALPRALEGGTGANGQRNLGFSHCESPSDRALQQAAEGGAVRRRRLRRRSKPRGLQRPGKSAPRPCQGRSPTPCSPPVLSTALPGRLHAERTDAASASDPGVNSWAGKGVLPKTPGALPNLAAPLFLEPKDRKNRIGRSGIAVEGGGVSSGAPLEVARIMRKDDELRLQPISPAEPGVIPARDREAARLIRGTAPVRLR